EAGAPTGWFAEAGDASTEAVADDISIQPGTVVDEPVVEAPAFDDTPSYSGAVEVPAIDEPVVDTPVLPSEPSTAWQTSSEPAPAAEQTSLADDLAALASQIEDDHPAPAPAEESNGWAASDSSGVTAAETVEPTIADHAVAA